MHVMRGVVPAETVVLIRLDPLQVLFSFIQGAILTINVSFSKFLQVFSMAVFVQVSIR